MRDTGASSGDPWREFLTDLVSLMRPRAEKRGLSLELASEGKVPETIETDPVRLRQILINFLGNAIAAVL